MRLLIFTLLFLFNVNTTFALGYTKVLYDGRYYYCNSSGTCIDSYEYTKRRHAYQQGLNNSIGQDVKIEYRDSDGNLVDNDGNRIDENGNRVNSWTDWLDLNKAIDKVRDKIIK